MKMSRAEFLSLSGIEHETLGAWIEQEWLIPSGSSVEPSFTGIDIARARLIRELLVDFGVNTEGVGVILNLVDQLHGVRRTLAELRRAVRTTPEE
jgi:chaperone modulatory protein CbpM